ncbi:hypothetical protein BSF38_02836 [Paludisphaera borealis]|uniref:Uncharacterized protein n=2 Tax=Paludisphaera borealis TaxID=1387353 RepID=A0A1U7CQW4_9BACT|nr:hypothetical protein BSF38_02836 [Paludisphaera borealis]
MLTDGKSTCLAIRSTTELAARKVGYSVELFPDLEGSVFRERFDFILPIGLKHTGNRFTADVALVRDGQSKVKELDLDFDFAGRKTSKVVFQSLKEKGPLRVHILDMERGGLPLESQDMDSNGTVVNTVRYYEFERLRDQCWLPRKKVAFSPLGKSARVVRVISQDVDRRPSAKEFKLNFSAPVQIPDLTKQIIYNQVSEFEFNASPSLKSHVRPMLVKPSPDESAPPVMPGELEPASWAFPVMLGSACCLILGALVFVFRRR